MSQLEDLFLVHLRTAALPTPEREYRFTDTRRWRLDFAWPVAMVALEIDGATWTRGRHTRGAGVQADCEKLSEAAVRGWRVLRVTGAMVRDGRACALVSRALQLSRRLDSAPPSS